MVVDQKVLYISIPIQLKVIKEREQYTYQRMLNHQIIFGHMSILDMIMIKWKHMVHSLDQVRQMKSYLIQFNINWLLNCTSLLEVMSRSLHSMVKLVMLVYIWVQGLIVKEWILDSNSCMVMEQQVYIS
jgi:hypothetical protein